MVDHECMFSLKVEADQSNIETGIPRVHARMRIEVCSSCMLNMLCHNLPLPPEPFLNAYKSKVSHVHIVSFSGHEYARL